MKIVVLYGQGEVGKRTEMLRIKQQFSPDAVSIFDLSQNKLSEINLTLSSKSLFDSSDKLLIIENTPDDLDLKKIVKIDNPATLIFLASSPKATSKLLLSAKEIKARIIEFKIEKETLPFPFLDNLIEGKKEVFGQLNKLQGDYGGMYILSMIYYLLRRNLLPPPLSSFMKNKIELQKQKLSLRDWQKLYFLTLKTDFDIKNGNLSEIIALAKLTQEFINYTQNTLVN